MKREKFLWPLSQSHHRALVAAKRVKESLSGVAPQDEAVKIREMTREIQDFYEGELRQHFWDEERILALFENRMGAGEPEPEKMRRDHRLLESLMNQPTRANLLKFAETLTHHVRFEEDVAFGRIEMALTEDDKKAVDSFLKATAPKC